MPANIALIWFRQDLRLDDNPALRAAIERGAAVIPVFTWNPPEEGAWPPGAASRWWLHQSLNQLESDLRRRGSRLILRKGPSAAELPRLASEVGATAVFWNRRYEPAAIARDSSIKTQLRGLGLEVQSFNGNLLFEPWDVKTKEGKPYQVYTPYWKTLLTLPAPANPTPAPPRLSEPPRWPSSVPLDDLYLEPTINWAAGMRDFWTPGAAGALARLDAFLDQTVNDYADQRDRPDVEGTSCLSPHLHFGEISPRTIWHALRGRFDFPTHRGAEVFLKELAWREFAHHLLFHFPHTPETPLREPFRAFPWETDPGKLRAWQRGRTGYPLVDAGMRQLWETGWMHNRVRMVVASFLVKHLRISWLEGARWFWDTLVDADLANNTLGWQWTAGCGADAAPYFRIFNPISQGEKFDPTGDYVRRWVPELANLPAAWIHKPWEAPSSVLASAGVQLGQTYPEPVVDHAKARVLALQALATIRSPTR